MKTLLDERFAPTTSAVGFLQLPLDAAADHLERWRTDLYPTVHRSALTGRLGDVLPSLEPLVVGARPRELLVEAGAWTAYFDCSFQGTDAVSTIGHLSRTVPCQGVAIRTVPHTDGLAADRPGRYGAVQFELFGPLSTEFMNYVRTVSASHDGRNWVFNASGTEQAFEEADAYGRRRKRDRFTSDMLERYCRAMGIEVFAADAYGPGAVLLDSAVPMPDPPVRLSIEEAQARLGIVPGQACDLPG